MKRLQVVERDWAVAPAAVTPFCHGSTLLALSGDELLAAWFGGTWEAEPDSGIYLARRTGGRWQPPELVVPPEGHAHGNAVLLREPGGRVLLCYFRNYGEWCTGGMTLCRASDNGGRSWGPERPVSQRLGLLLKNKPWISPAGEILLPVYDEVAWQAGIARSADGGCTWQVCTEIGAGSGVPMIQGALALDGRRRLHMFLRTRTGCVYDAISTDAGATWGAPFALGLPNPNSGIDALGLDDGRLLLVYNPSRTVAQNILSAAERNYRYPLVVALSADDGATWTDVLTLESEPGEYSYPAIVAGSDGLIHVSYTYQRAGIRHVALGWS